MSRPVVYVRRRDPRHHDRMRTVPVLDWAKLRKAGRVATITATREYSDRRTP